MPYSIVKLPDEPVVISTLYADYNNSKEGEASMSDTTVMLDAQAEPVYYVFDVSKYSPSLDDVLASVNWGGVKCNTPSFSHPNVREPIIVSRSAMVKLAAKGLKSATWGNKSIQVFDTLDEALAYTRQ